MPASTLVRKTSSSSIASFETLVQKINETFVRGRERIRQEMLHTYWQTGQYIHQHLLHHERQANYGAQVVRRLSEKMQMSSTSLWEMLQVYRRFPKILRSGGESLGWSHFRKLATIEDEKIRKDFLSRAVDRHWTAEVLQEKINEELRRKSKNASDKKTPEPAGKTDSFRSKRGTPGVYKIIKAEGKEQPEKLLDLGFSFVSGLTTEERSRFSEGDLVQVKGSSLVKFSGTAGDLYTYRAYVARVVDGDTLWVRIHLGYDLWVRQKLRLRGIDAPELKTSAGDSAKRFVEAKLADVREINVTTTKPDKFDRYLSDIWIGDENLNQLLLAAGHARVKTDYSEDDWDFSNWGRF